jgi:hypothetical protein
MNKEEMLAIFTLLGVEVWNYWELPNNYWPEAYVEQRKSSPWWLIQTKYGLIKIGKRKRVFHIDWEATPYRIEVTQDDVTKDERMVHAWDILKVVEYLKTFFDYAQSQSEPSISGHWHHGNGTLCCGTLRIAREDFDTNPNPEFKKEIFDWICTTLNKANGK